MNEIPFMSREEFIQDCKEKEWHPDYVQMYLEIADEFESEIGIPYNFFGEQPPPIIHSFECSPEVYDKYFANKK